MGQDPPPDNMIRIALLACTAALAAAEADALYGIAGHHLGYGVGHVGYAAHHVAPVHHAVHVHHGYGISNVANTVGIHGAAPAAIPAVHDAYATGHPHNVGVITGVDYGYGRVSGYGAIGHRGYAGYGYAGIGHYYG